MGEFLAEVATAGAQVIMETHSDHVLNGIRRAVKKRLLAADDAALHFFRPRGHSEQERLPQVHSPILDSDGNIDSWPDGFFDQFDKDMKLLRRLGLNWNSWPMTCRSMGSSMTCRRLEMRLRA